MRSLVSLFLDLCLVLAGTLSAVAIRDNFDISNDQFISLIPYLSITLCIAGVVLFVSGINRSLWQFTSLREYLRIVVATTLIVASAVAIGFQVNRLDGVARALPVLQGLLVIAFLVGARVVRRALHTRRVRPERAPTPGADTVLVIGITKLTELYLLCVSESDSSSVRVAGLLDEGGRTGLSVHSHPVLGTPEQIAKALRYLEVRGVFVNRIVATIPRSRLSVAARAALDDVRKTTTIRLEYLAERLGIRAEDDDGASQFPPPANGPAAGAIALAGTQIPYYRIKRLGDGFAAAALLCLLAPIILLVGGLVVADIGLPLIFWQERPGLRSRPFRLYKFRTMGDAYDADGRRLADHDRVSPVGNFLRRARLDELPQLFNILKGDMSFVGPRPLLPVDQPADGGSRLAVRPGLTGWAQIKGGRQISATDKVALDLWYVRNMSFALDLEILLGTVPMLLFGDRIKESAIVDAWRDSAVTDALGRPLQEKAA